MTAATPEAAYEALEHVIRRELEATAAGDFQAIAALKRERAAIICTLPATPPAQARAVLQRCLTLQGQIAGELHTVRSAILRDLEHVRRARRTASGYAAARSAHRRVSASA